METLRPIDEAEVRAIVAEGQPMEIVGHGSRRALGAPVEADRVLDLSRLAGVVIYEPNELVLTVKAATPMAEIAALLAGEGQHLAFEPPDLGPLWGRSAGGGTIGGAVSVGFGGSRRPSAGAPRDHLLGFRAVNGTGEAFAAGGRVVKNVTGFDLPKLMAGAQGTMGVLTELTLKVLPAPPAVRTLCFFDLEERTALALLREASGSPVSVSAAAHLPADIATRLGIVGPATLLRIEGAEATADLAVDRLKHGFPAEKARSAVMDDAASASLWRGVGGAFAFAGSDEDVWRISIPRALAFVAGEALRRAGATALYYDWAGGLIWAQGPLILGADFAGVPLNGRRVRGDGAPQVRPETPGVAALSARLKAQFDPLGLFNPGRGAA